MSKSRKPSSDSTYSSDVSSESAESSISTRERSGAVLRSHPEVIIQELRKLGINTDVLNDFTEPKVPDNSDSKVPRRFFNTLPWRANVTKSNQINPLKQKKQTVLKDLEFLATVAERLVEYYKKNDENTDPTMSIQGGEASASSAEAFGVMARRVREDIESIKKAKAPRDLEIQISIAEARAEKYMTNLQAQLVEAHNTLLSRPMQYLGDKPKTLTEQPSTPKVPPSRPW